MDTHTAILDAAEDVARARGYDGFSYADLAARVGIKKASIHHHFPTKAGLAAALAQRYRERAGARLDAVAADAGTAGETLAAFLQLYRATLGNADRLCLCVALAAGHDSLDAATCAEVERHHRQVVTWLAGVFAAGAVDGTIAGVQDPQREAEACLALVIGAQLTARAAATLSPFDAAVRLLAERIGSRSSG